MPKKTVIAIGTLGDLIAKDAKESGKPEATVLRTIIAQHYGKPELLEQFAPPGRPRKMTPAERRKFVSKISKALG